MKPGASKVSPGLGYMTRELSPEALPDFERLLETHPAPGAYACWCMYHHRPGPVPEAQQPHTKAQRAASNRRQKRELVEQGRSHGILVFAEGKPVGWCQYGTREELPRVENNAGYRKHVSDGIPSRLWRITCFVVDKRYRRRGVARLALRAALEAIRGRGGGMVEAYPIVRWGAYAEYRGTVSMFRKEGFEIVAPFGKHNVVMRKAIGPQRSKSSSTKQRPGP
jgi:ribosomal protein S18 acetylase RimI-like enzyme